MPRTLSTCSLIFCRACSPFIGVITKATSMPITAPRVRPMPNHNMPGGSLRCPIEISGTSAFLKTSFAFLPASVVRSLKMSRRSFVLTMSNPPAFRWLRLFRSRSGATCPPGERCLDEHVDIAIQHARGVPDLHGGAVVLHHGVGVEHVRADLATPVRRAHLAPLACLLLLLAANPLLEQARLQDAHRGLPVLELRTLVLA